LKKETVSKILVKII